MSHVIGRCMRALFAGVLLALASSGMARAHDGASWIMEHPDHGWCCGPQDCFWLESRDVRIEQDHYVVDRLAIRWPIVGSFRSADHRYWVCTFMRGTSLEQVKCFFAPRSPAM